MEIRDSLRAHLIEVVVIHRGVHGFPPLDKGLFRGLLREVLNRAVLKGTEGCFDGLKLLQLLYR